MHHFLTINTFQQWLYCLKSWQGSLAAGKYFVQHRVLVKLCCFFLFKKNPLCISVRTRAWTISPCGNSQQKVCLVSSTLAVSAYPSIVALSPLCLRVAQSRLPAAQRIEKSLYFSLPNAKKTRSNNDAQEQHGFLAMCKTSELGPLWKSNVRTCPAGGAKTPQMTHP